MPIPKPVVWKPRVRLLGVDPLVGPTRSHPDPLLVVDVTLNGRATVGSVLVSAIVCEAGLVPSCALTFTTDGLTFNNGELQTFRVTGMVSGLFPTVMSASVLVIVMDPLQVPTATPWVLMATATVPGVVPEDGEALRNWPPQLLDIADTE